MEKMKFETPDGNALNIAKIAELFPAAVSEGKVNFEMLRTLLGDEICGDEAYEFTWVGKREAVREAGRPIRKTLRPCPAESKDWDTTENLYIEGDNLDVLKLLQQSYLGKVKMIYIDPPYNTGNDFVYRDNFTQSRQEHEEEAGVYNDEGDRLFKNTETNGRFHSDWCSMIYPRLVLARNLLRNDGVIFISIDDNEVAQLRKICDEIFGEHNFIAEMVWQQGKKSSGNLIGTNHEYMLVFSKSKSILDTPSNTFRQRKQGLEKIYKKYNQLTKIYGSNYEKIQSGMKEFYSSLSDNDPAYTHRLYCLVDERGLFQSDNSAAPDKPETRSHRPLIHPITKKKTAVPNMGWRFTDETLDKLVAEDRICFGEDETIIPRVKRYLNEYEYEMPSTVFYKPGAAASSELQKVFDNKVFDNPKDRTEIQRIINFCTSYVFTPSVDNDARDEVGYSRDIILDFFSGSATTAHAVMQLNAEDGGRRKFIMVQLPEKCEEGTEAAKAGYKNICEIGKERIRRAGKKILEELTAKDAKNTKEEGRCLFSDSDREMVRAFRGSKDLDVGFRVLKLDESNMKDVYFPAGDYSKELVEAAKTNIKEGRSDMDLLYGCLLEWGLPLSLPHTHEEIDGVTVHTYHGGSLIACFADNVSDEVVKEIAKRQPLRAVFRDSSFKDSPSKINVEAIFKVHSPRTSVKVI